MAALESLGGATLIVAICGLLFIEEVGVPLPFAPGDLVLAVAGIAIASGTVNPVLTVGLIYLATVVGAVLGREIFALLGWSRLMKIARPLHAQRPLERAAELLHRSGWRAVFTARLIPGLRVHTTQVAGVTQMPRLSFVLGLLPAAAVYVAGFVGLGAAFGRPVLALIHESEHNLLLAVLTLVAAVAAIVGIRIGVRRSMQVLEMGGWTGPLLIRLDALGIMVIPACLGINIAGHAVAVALKLPLFLDSGGTVLCGVLAGPWVGASLGVISNLVSGNTFDSNAGPYAIVSFAIGFAAGLSRYLAWQRRVSGWLLLWAVCAVIASVLSTPINFLVAGGRTGVPLGDDLSALLASAHLPRVFAAFVGEAAIDVPDKLITVVTALLIAQALSHQPAESGAIHVDLREPFNFIVRSPNWLRKTLIGAACVLFFWLILPYLLLVGYLVAVARTVRNGGSQLPEWTGLWPKVKDGFRVSVLFALWSLPAILMSGVGGVGADPDVQAALHLAPVTRGLASGVEILGNLWQFMVLVTQPAVWSLYLDRGTRAALSPAALFGRLRANPSLTVVVGGLSVALVLVGIVGVIGLVVGVLLTQVWAGWVWAHLVGTYARLTDPLSPSAREAFLGARVGDAGKPQDKRAAPPRLGPQEIE